MTKEEFIQERTYLTGVSPKTVVWYKTSFRAFKDALESKKTVVARIAELKGKGTSHITINSYLRCVNAYFMWLHKEHSQPLIRIPKLKEEQKVLATLSEDGIRKLLAFKPKGTNATRAYMLALVALDTGLRAAEILGLAKEDVDFEQLTIKAHGKGGKHRFVPFSVELRKVLFRYLSGRTTRYVFGTKNNTKLSLHNLNRDLKVIGKQVGITGIRFSAHTFRHSFSVMYLRAGGNLEFLRRILGHTNLSTTQKYLKSLGVEDLGAVHSTLSPLSRLR